MNNNQIPWYDEEYFNKYIKNNLTFFQDGKFIAIEFTNQYSSNGKHYKFKCSKCNHKFIYSAYEVYNNRLRLCPNCEQNLKDSLGVATIKNFLNQNYTPFETEYRDYRCSNVYPLRFDFKIDTNLQEVPFILIEYDGGQHYIGWGGNYSSLQQIQYRDNLKNIFCYNNGIPLIRIPYWFSESTIIKSLQLVLQIFNLKNYNLDTLQPIYNNFCIYDYIIYYTCYNFSLTKKFLSQNMQQISG